MRNLHRLCWIIATALISHVAAVQAADPQTQVTEFFAQQRSFLREKTWLHLDKPYYAAGDSIWFKAYLVDAIEHRADTLSNFLYVELMNQQKQVVLAKKIKRDSCGFSNCLGLPPRLPAGEYTLRAYTGWMLNFDPELLFQRNLHIGNSIANLVQSTITYTHPGEGGRRAIVRFLDLDEKPYRDVPVKYTLFDATGKQLSTMQQNTSITGAVIVDLPSDSLRKEKSMEVVIENENLKYKHTFFLPEDDKRFAIQFFPEGGDLMAGANQRIAFKGEGSDGHAMEVTGVILGNTGDTLARFASEHDGMGVFLMVPQAGQRYQAHVQSAKGATIQVTLPAVKEAGYTLSAIQTEDQIRYQVYTPGESITDSLLLIGHLRGQCMIMQPINPQNPSGMITTASIPEGILHLLVIDNQGVPRSERLLFITHPDYREQWQITPNKTVYGKREKVSLDITLTDADAFPSEGDFSVSITDRKSVVYDPLADNIYTHLLLCSDLKGYIESPAYYFKDDSAKTRYFLDLVLLTHGWRRFDTQLLRKQQPFVPKYFMEYGQHLSGHITGMMGKDAPQTEVTALDMGQGTFVTATTDSTGHFVMEGFSVQDTTFFILSAKTQKGKPVEKISLSESYPRPTFSRNVPIPVNDTLPILENYLEKTKNKYQIENGVKVYELKEFEITATNPNAPKSSAYGTVYDTAALAQVKHLSLYNYVVGLPGVYRQSGQLLMKTRGLPGTSQPEYQTVLITVNGQDCPSDELAQYTVNDVEYLSVIRKADMQMLSSSNYAMNNDPYRIDVILKKGVSSGNSEARIQQVIGYAKNVQFYTPTYDTPEQQNNCKSDIRTTIYWNPSLKIDETGETTLDFYTDDSDKPEYEITIEGMTPNGEAYHYRQKL